MRSFCFGILQESGLKSPMPIERQTYDIGKAGEPTAMQRKRSTFRH